MILHYDFTDLQPYINWVYFYHAWQLRDTAEQQRIRHEAEAFLDALDNRYQAHALFLLADAYADGDDIVIRGKRKEERGKWKEERLPMLRQQQEGSDYLCMADFIAPRTSHLEKKTILVPPYLRTPVPPNLSSHHHSPDSKIGLFATSVDRGMETDFEADPYQKMMAQLLADRLAEAAAERLHEQVRKVFWGYARDEQLSIPEMHQEHFQGIRPAVGYPSLPDTSLNFLLDELLDLGRIGITLTESGAMRPHASVSGLMISHPKARYFPVGKIGTDQLHDYARRRGLPVDTVRTFLAANL